MVYSVAYCADQSQREDVNDPMKSLGDKRWLQLQNRTLDLTATFGARMQVETTFDFGNKLFAAVGLSQGFVCCILPDSGVDAELA